MDNFYRKPENKSLIIYEGSCENGIERVIINARKDFRDMGGGVMFYHAKSKTIQMGNTSMDYITFGTGEKNLIMIPGVGDGLRTTKGLAIPMALLYGKFAKDYTVYFFSRKNHLPEKYSTRKMAKDQKEAMDILGIEKADIVGVSQGGMIAQHLAIEYPEVVNKLVLVVTAARKNQYAQATLSGWIEIAKREDYKRLMIDSYKKMYTKEYLKKNHWLLKMAVKIGKPKSFERFITLAYACIHHDTYDFLDKIQAPTLVIGGEQDRTLGGKASRELAERIPNAQLKMYPQYGHALYDEAKDFYEVVLNFLQ